MRMMRERPLLAGQVVQKMWVKAWVKNKNQMWVKTRANPMPTHALPRVPTRGWAQKIMRVGMKKNRQNLNVMIWKQTAVG